MVDLPARSFQHIALAGGTQFRLQFSVDDDNDRQADGLELYSGNAVEAKRPVLVVQYDLP